MNTEEENHNLSDRSHAEDDALPTSESEQQSPSDSLHGGTSVAPESQDPTGREGYAEMPTIPTPEPIGEETVFPTDEIEPQEDTIDLTFLKLDTIQHQLDKLQQDFESKLKYDAHKNTIIDHLHQELQAYKNDILKQQMQSTLTDLIKIIDDIRKLAAHYRSQDPEQWDPAKMLDLFENIPSDLEDMLFYQGVEPYTCEDDTFDATCQRVLKKIATTERARDKTVARSLRPGYKWEGKIIRPEMVAVHVYRESEMETEMRSSHE